MWPFIFSLIFAGAVLWLLRRVLQQNQLYETLRPETASDDFDLPTVAVIVPARNEASNIATCLDSLLDQSYPHDRLEIIAVDDNSTDGTAGIIRERATRDDRVRLLQAGALPAGWAGKPHACWIGALATDAEWLCFVDADTEAEPALLRSALHICRERGCALLSLSPFQELMHFFDRLIIPLGFLAIAASIDHARANRSPAEISVNGQFILIRAECYFAVGGHSSVRDQICEDAALARSVKGHGLPIGLLGGETLMRTRMYRTAGELWEGFAKNVTQTFGGLARTSIIAVLSLVLGWSTLLGPAWAVTDAIQRPHALEILAASIALLVAAAAIAIQIALARHFRIPMWYGLLFPLGCSIGALLAIDGVLKTARGRVHWKGRSYPAKSGAGRMEISQSTRPRSHDL